MNSPATNAPQVPLLRTDGDRALVAAERAEARVDLDALEIEAVAHDDADSAAEWR